MGTSLWPRASSLESDHDYDYDYTMTITNYEHEILISDFRCPTSHHRGRRGHREIHLSLIIFHLAFVIGQRGKVNG